LNFFKEVMFLGSRVRAAFFAQGLKVLACRENLDEQKVVANQGDDLPVRIKRILAKHRPGREPVWMAQFVEHEFNCFFLSCHRLPCALLLIQVLFAPKNINIYKC